MISIPFIDLHSLNLSTKFRNKRFHTKIKESTQSETLCSPCWLQSHFSPWSSVVPKLPPRSVCTVPSAHPGADARAEIEREEALGQRVAAVVGVGGEAKKGFPKPAVQPCVTSGLWRHQQDGTCNLTHPRHHLWRNHQLPWSHPSPFTADDWKNWRQSQSRASPLSKPTFVVRRYGFRSQTFLDFSTFLIFPISKKWKLETNVLVNSGYCPPPQPWQSILPSIMWTEATSWCLEVYSEYTVINRHRRRQLTLWGISKWLTQEPQPFPETQLHSVKMHLCPHLGTLLPGLRGPCRERSFWVNSPQLSLTQQPTRGQAAAGSGRSSVKTQGLRAGQKTPTSACSPAAHRNSTTYCGTALILEPGWGWEGGVRSLQWSIKSIVQTGHLESENWGGERCY